MDAFAVAPTQLEELIAKLTPRQLQVVELLAQGCDYEQICSILSISRTGAKHHVIRACRKLDVENRILLIVLYVRWKERRDIKRTVAVES